MGLKWLTAKPWAATIRSDVLQPKKGSQPKSMTHAKWQIIFYPVLHGSYHVEIAAVGKKSP